MENFIKEGKDGFDFTVASNKTKFVNANRLQLHMLGYTYLTGFSI